MKKLICFLFGHDKSREIVAYRLLGLDLTIDEGYAEICLRCFKQLSNVTFESEAPPIHPHCRSLLKLKTEEK